MNVEMGDSHLRKQMQSSKMCLSPVYSCLKSCFYLLFFVPGEQFEGESCLWSIPGRLKFAAW